MMNWHWFDVLFYVASLSEIFFPTDNNLIPAKSFWLTANQYTTQQLLLLLLEHKNLLKV